MKWSLHKVFFIAEGKQVGKRAVRTCMLLAPPWKWVRNEINVTFPFL